MDLEFGIRSYQKWNYRLGIDIIIFITRCGSNTLLEARHRPMYMICKWKEFYRCQTQILCVNYSERRIFSKMFTPFAICWQLFIILILISSINQTKLLISTLSCNQCFTHCEIGKAGEFLNCFIWNGTQKSGIFLWKWEFPSSSLLTAYEKI